MYCKQYLIYIGIRMNCTMYMYCIESVRCILYIYIISAKVLEAISLLVSPLCVCVRFADEKKLLQPQIER